MSDPTFKDITDYITSAGIIGILVLIIFSNLKGWWISERTHMLIVKPLIDQLAEIKEELAGYKEQVIIGVKQAERATAVAEVTTKALADCQSLTKRG